MRILIVARCKNGRYAPFITEQVESIESQGVKCQFFGVDRKGFWGYLQQIPLLKKAIKEYNPDVIHAHYGLCGLLASFQRRIPVVTTYHGSDINDSMVFRLSKQSIRQSRFNVFVSQKNIDMAKPQRDFSLIPCGVNLEDYPVVEKNEARRQMGLDSSLKYILFAGAYDNPIKNASLAKAAVALLQGVVLLELKGYSRQQVAILMQAVDAFLMTSFTEGSPQVIKEAMVCGCPIVSVDVGDVKEQISGLGGCYLAERNAEHISEQINRAINFHGRTEGRKKIVERRLTNDMIASKLIEVYKLVKR